MNKADNAVKSRDVQRRQSPLFCYYADNAAECPGWRSVLPAAHLPTECIA